MNSTNSKSETRPGRKPKGEEPLVLLVDDAWYSARSSELGSDHRVKLDSTKFEEELDVALAPQQIKGIVVQLDPKGRECCHGLAVAERIRRKERGTPVIVFVSDRKDPTCPKNSKGCKHYPRLHKLIRNRGSFFMQTTASTTRADVVKAIGSIDPLTEMARLNIELNYLDLHGRLTHLLEHDMKSDELGDAAMADTLRLAAAFSTENAVQAVLKKVVAIRKRYRTEYARMQPLRALTPELLSHFHAPNSTAANFDAQPLKDCHVLLVEDDKKFADELEAKLKELGCIVTPLADGTKAENILKRKEHEAHAVISDWELLDGNGDPQVARQGFELLTMGGKEITVRIALTSMSSRTRSAIGSTLLRSGVPNLRMYRKGDLKTRAVWDCFVRDIADSAQWSKRIIQERLNLLGMGTGDFGLWQEYFMTIEGEVGKRREQEVSKAASAWWKDLSKELDDSYTSTTKIKDLIVSSNNTFPGRPGNRGSLEFMLIVRRVTFASLVWLVQRYGVHDLEKIIQGYVNTKSNALIAAGPFRAGVPKVFKNSHSIKTDQLQQGKGLLKEERDWLKETFGEFSFESIASRKP